MSAERKQIWTTESPYAYGPAKSETFLCWKNLALQVGEQNMQYEMRESRKYQLMKKDTQKGKTKYLCFYF